MKKLGDISSSLIFIIIGLIASIIAFRYKIGSATEPHAGFFPLLGGITLTVLSVILFFQAFYGRSNGIREIGDLVAPIKLLLGFVFYVLTLEILGFLVSTTILSIILLNILKAKPLRWMLTVSLIFTTVSYVVFDRLLDVPLPEGIFFKLW